MVEVVRTNLSATSSLLNFRRI